MRQKTGKPRVGLFIVCTLFFWFSLYAYMPTMTPYLTSLGISYTMIGLIGGSYGFAQMVLRVPLGIASDRLGKRKLFIVIGLFIGGFSALGMFFTQNAFLLLTLRFLVGVCTSSWVLFTVLFSGYYDREKYASRTSYLLMVNNCGAVLSKLAGSMLAERVGHRYTFLLSSAVGLAAGVMSLFITEKAPETTEHPPIKELLSVIKNRNLLVMSTLAALSQMVLFSTINTFTPDAAARVGAGPVQLGIMSTVASIPAIFTALAGGRIFSKGVSVRLIVTLGFTLSASGTVMIAFTGSLVLIFVSAILIGAGCGLCMSTLLSFCSVTIEEDRRSAAMGVFQAVYSIGMFAGPVLIGLFVDAISLSSGFIAAAALALMGLVTALSLLNKEKSNKQDGKLQPPA